jgi:hypothetical protein
MLRIEPFEVDVDQQVLDDLHDRLRGARWPDPAPALRGAKGPT